jgi:hypothetical protein
VLRFFYGQTFHDRMKKRKLNMTQQKAPKVVEVYLQRDFYNPRLRATIPGAWIAVYDNGDEVAVCAGHSALTSKQVFEKLKARG